MALRTLEVVAVLSLFGLVITPDAITASRTGTLENIGGLIHSFVVSCLSSSPLDRMLLPVGDRSRSSFSPGAGFGGSWFSYVGFLSRGWQGCGQAICLVGTFRVV